MATSDRRVEPIRWLVGPPRNPRESGNWTRDGEKALYIADISNGCPKVEATSLMLQDSQRRLTLPTLPSRHSTSICPRIAAQLACQVSQASFGSPSLPPGLRDCCNFSGQLFESFPYSQSCFCRTSFTFITASRCYDLCHTVVHNALNLFEKLFPFFVHLFL